MPLLALIGNPPGSRVRRRLRRRAPNPLTFTGPSITFAPFSPIQKVSVDLLGVGWDNTRNGAQQNPASSLVSNVVTGEVRRYPLPPSEALASAAAQDGVNPPMVQRIPGWARSGAWYARLANPRGEVGIEYDVPHSWSRIALELIHQSRVTDWIRDHQPRAERPIARINVDAWRDVMAKIHRGLGKSGEEKPAAVMRHYERWKQATRLLGLERLDGYDYDHPQGPWFAFDVLMTWDLVWANVGTPHPLSSAWPAFPISHKMGRARERELLASAEQRLRGLRPTIAELRREFELERARGEHASFGRMQMLVGAIKSRERVPTIGDVREEQRRSETFWTAPPSPSTAGRMSADVLAARIKAVRAGIDPDTVAPITSGGSRPHNTEEGRRARLFALRPSWEEHVQRMQEEAARRALPPPAPEPFLPSEPTPIPLLPPSEVRYGRVFEEEEPTRPDWLAGRFAPAPPCAPAPQVELAAPTARARRGRPPRPILPGYEEAVAKLRALGYGPAALARMAQLPRRETFSTWLAGKFVPPIEVQQRIIAGAATTTAPAPPHPSHSAEHALRYLSVQPEQMKPILDAIPRFWHGTDRELEKAIGSRVGWLAKARAGLARHGKAKGSWRRLYDFLATLAAEQGATMGFPRLNPTARAELAYLTNPERPRRRNRDAKWKQEPERIPVPLEELREHPDFDLSGQKFKRFHGTAPTGGFVLRIPDGKPGVTRDPHLYVALHETLETPYVVPWPSVKRGENPDDPQVWFHEHPAGSRPLEVLNPRTGVTSKVGGSYVVDDWWYS